MKPNLKKYMILTFLIIINLAVLGQEKIIKEKDIFYCDTVGEFIQFGRIEPTDIIQTNDNCYIITSQKKIYFKEYWKRNKEFDYEFYKKIYSKEKYWSSIIKTDTNFQTLWEIKLEDRYVKAIVKNKNSNFYISGSVISENKIWIGEITINGKLLWSKDYKIGSNKISYSTQIQKQIISQNGDVLIIGEKGHLKFIRKYGKSYPFYKRIQFFNEDYKNDYFIACFDSIGDKKWIKSYTYANSIYLHLDFCSNQKNEIFTSSAKTGYNNNFSTKLSLLTNKGKLIWENEVQKSVLYVKTYKDKFLTCGIIDSIICLQLIDIQGNIIETKKMLKYVPNRQFKIIWVSETINSDIAEGIIWLQNNKMYKFKLVDTELTWNEIPIKTDYISFNKAIETNSNGFVFIGYRYFDPSDKPLDLVQYMKIIEIQ